MRRLQYADRKVSLAQIEKTVLAEHIKTLEIEVRSIRAEKQSLKQMVEKASNTDFDQRQKKGGYILSILDVYVDSTSEPLTSFTKY